VSISAQLTSEQLKENIEDPKHTDKGTREVQEQVENGEEVVDPASSRSVLRTVLDSIDKELNHDCLQSAVGLLNTNLICPLDADCVPGNKF